MNTVKGFRFHPTDAELIEFLQIKTFDRDSLVQVIDEVPDICQSEPCQLAERSTLQTGDRLWYFIYSPKYRYRNSKRVNRTTGEGYWKPTGNARKIIDPETGKVIGTKKTLVYYKGQCNDKNKIKTCWVMHEYELKSAPSSTDTNQKTFNLCKLKKKVDISSIDAAQSSQHNDCDAVLNQSGCTDCYAGERSNQHNVVNDDVVPNLSSSFVNPVVEDAISKETLHLKEMSKECIGLKDNNGVQKLYNTMEKDDESCISVLTNGDETFTIKRSNQHDVTIADEGFGVPSSFEDLAADDNLIPMELLYDDGLSFDELLEGSEPTNNSKWIQNQSITNLDFEFFNSFSADNNEANLQEENRLQGLAGQNEGMIESLYSIEKPRKRQRLSHDVHVETAEAQSGGSITNQ